MCHVLVPVAVTIDRKVPYSTPSGRLKYRRVTDGHETVMLRCGHDITDYELNIGYYKVDQFGRPILCDEHRQVGQTEMPF